MSIGERIKKAIGIEGSVKESLLPMLAYNARFISTSGGFYLISLYYHAFLTYVEGLSLGQAGVVLLVKNLWDAAIDPFLGLLTDRTRSRMGRHRIYILLGAVPFGLAFVTMWSSFGVSAGGQSGRVMLYYIFANIFFTGMYSVICVPHDAMLPELAPDYFQRTQYISVGYILNTAGQAPSFLLASVFLGMVNTREFSPGLRPTFLKMGLLLGAVYILPILATALFTKEKSSRDMVFPPVDYKYVLNEYGLVFKNRAFLQHFAMYVLVLSGISMFLSSRQYFVYEVADAKQYLNMLVLWAGIAEASAFPLNYALTKKFGKAKMAWFTLPFLVVSLGLSFFIGPQRPGTGIPWMIVGLFVQELLQPFGVSGVSFAVETIAPDVTDVDELITGRRREGVILAFKSFAQVSAKGVLQFLLGVVLEWFGVEIKNENGVSNALFKARASDLLGPKLGGPATGLRVAHGALPLLFTGLALIALRRYTMTRQEHSRIREAVAAKHAGEPLDLSESEIARIEELAGQKWDSMWIGRDAT